MTQRERFSPNEYYHVYNRGVEKRNIFADDTDKRRFVSLLYAANSTNPFQLKVQGRTLEELMVYERGEQLVNICAYCLMSNHYHLLLQEKTEGGISKFVQKLFTGYTMYFNKRYERTGALFQGKYKSTHANDDRYLKYLISYIHLNPIDHIEPDWKKAGVSNKQKAEHYLKNYRYSSYPDFLGLDRIERAVLTPGALPEYFEEHNSFESEVDEWISSSRFYTEL